MEPEVESEAIQPVGKVEPAAGERNHRFRSGGLDRHPEASRVCEAARGAPRLPRRGGRGAGTRASRAASPAANSICGIRSRASRESTRARSAPDPFPQGGMQDRTRVEHGQPVPELLAKTDEGAPLAGHEPHSEPGLAAVAEARSADGRGDPLGCGPGRGEGGDHLRLPGPEPGIRFEMLPVATTAVEEVGAARGDPSGRRSEHVYQLPLVVPLAPPAVADPDPLSGQGPGHPEPPAVRLRDPAPALVHRTDFHLDRRRRQRKGSTPGHRRRRTPGDGSDPGSPRAPEPTPRPDPRHRSGREPDRNEGR